MLPGPDRHARHPTSRGYNATRQAPAAEQAITTRTVDGAHAGDATGKRKRREAALAAGALSQDEFDDYDSELVSCIE